MVGLPNSINLLLTNNHTHRIHHLNASVVSGQTIHNLNRCVSSKQE
jgi:hypothetical protein